MDPNEGFFPEREVLRARRLGAMAEPPVNPARVRDERVAVWISVSVAICTPVFCGLAGIWNGHITHGALNILIEALSLVLVACAAIVAVKFWRTFFPRT
ncbi:MAG TPA: hypothetical protein VMF03_02275 [Steroidobacteraceae bacterium]|nr:hypothetical protein [Steroidobacteraceae bacterium]